MPKLTPLTVPAPAAPNTAPAVPTPPPPTFSVEIDPPTRTVLATVPVPDTIDPEAVREAIAIAVQAMIGGTWEREAHLVIDVANTPRRGTQTLVHVHAHRVDRLVAADQERAMLQRLTDAARGAGAADPALRAALSDADAVIKGLPSSGGAKA